MIIMIVLIIEISMSNIPHVIAKVKIFYYDSCKYYQTYAGIYQNIAKNPIFGLENKSK